jgi:hypothetical protein
MNKLVSHLLVASPAVLAAAASRLGWLDANLASVLQWTAFAMAAAHMTNFWPTLGKAAAQVDHGAGDVAKLATEVQAIAKKVEAAAAAQGTPS